MDVFEWIHRIRKKPLAERRQIAAMLSLIVMGCIAFVWFIFFFSGLSESVKSMPKIQIATPQLPKLDPEAETFLHQLGF